MLPICVPRRASFRSQLRTGCVVCLFIFKPPQTTITSLRFVSSNPTSNLNSIPFEAVVN